MVEWLIAGLVAVAMLVVLRITVTRRLLVKYAVLWVSVSLILALLALFPEGLYLVASAIGFEVPANLLFLVSIFLLLAISLQLSVELSASQAHLQRVAEELALLSQRTEQLEARTDPEP